MLTIFIIYSNDRKKQLDVTVSCLQEMAGYKHCQKVLCVDGITNVNIPDFEIANVRRANKFFNWSDAWKAGVSAARFNNLLYLDSDRVLPKNYLTQVYENLEDDKFIYSKSLIRLKEFYPLNVVKAIRDNPHQHSNLWMEDGRLPHPPNLSVLFVGKNPMSGNTAFTRATWLKTGGIDNSFEGWGFPDTEYYLRTWKMGMKFNTIDCVELHLQHEYGVSTSRFQLMSLWNAFKLASKFNMKLNQEFQSRMDHYKLTKELMGKFKNLDTFLKYTEKGNAVKLL